MNFATLPYEVQFNYLSSLPLRDVLNYCQTSTIAAEICDSEYFWEQRALRDFNVQLNVLTGDTPLKLYAELERLYYNYPGELAAIALQAGDLEALPNLLHRAKAVTRENGRIKLTSDVELVLTEAALTGSPNVLEEVLDLFTLPFTEMWAGQRSDLYDTLRGPFFTALLERGPSVANVLRKYYDPNEDRSETLDGWIDQWKFENSPNIISKLREAGVDLREDDDY